MNCWRKYLSLFLFLALLLVKVSSFHVYTHEHSDGEDNDDCLACEMVMENQQSEFFNFDGYHFEEVELATYPQTKFEVQSILISKELPFSWFSRPPPL